MILNKLKKRLLFITGTRADFGKLKPLIKSVHDSSDFDYLIFATGMHMLAKYGNTVSEIKRSGFDNLFMFINQTEGESMEMVLANTITGLTRFLHEHQVDMIVVHGDRIEALAGAIVGALRNVLVAHIEGGEVSGTIDDLLRHATSKLSHIHFVANQDAEKRLLQLGENEHSIFIIGSPDIDVMFSNKLPSLDEVRQHYCIDFPKYAIALLHPVTTEQDHQEKYAKIFVESLLNSDCNYVVIYPNNDLGSEEIFRAYKYYCSGNKKIKFFPSLRFEYFLTLLKHSQFIIGNSSAGIREAPVYGVPTIDIGSRQYKRFEHESIRNIQFDEIEIKKAIALALGTGRYQPSNHFGDGDSADKFFEAISTKSLWELPKQKKFNDLKVGS